MLGEPALVAAHHRRDAQRQALLSRAARCRRSPSRSSRSRASRGNGRCTCASRCTATATSFAPGASGAPTECTQGTNAPSLAEHVVHRAAHPRHQLHADDDVGAVRELDADVRDRAAERTHRERDDVHRASAHASRRTGRAACCASRRARPSCWSGPHPPRASLQMNVRSSTRATSVGSEQREVAVRALDGIEPRQRARRDHLAAQPVVFGRAAVAPVDAIGLGQRGDLAHPFEQARVTNVIRRADRRGERGERSG